MQVAAEKLSPYLLEPAVQIDAERVRSELSKAYNQLAKSAKIRGFRPGKAPRQVLSQMYGPRISRDVARRLVDDTYQEALSSQNVQVISQPDIETPELKENSPYTYKARVEIVPDIPDVKYSGFEVKRPPVAATEEAVLEELEQLRRANSTLEPPKEERASQVGDLLTVDFDVSVEGEIVADAGSRDFEVELGASNMIKELEAVLVGAKVGDVKAGTVKLTATHRHEKLRGKDATFTFTVKELKERKLPAADDEFAKDLEYEALDELKAALRGEVEKRLKEQSDNAVAEALVLELVKANPIEVPPSLVKQQDEATEKEALAQARARGAGQGSRLSQEQRAQIRADSEVKVRAGLLMAAIAKAEGIKIGDAEIEEGLKELAEQSNKNIAKLRAEYREKSKRDMLIGMILENKVLDVIEGKSKIVDAS
jgi:trigger factor